MDIYSRTYENVLSDDHCQHLIEMFESDTENHQVQDCGQGATLTKINLLHSPDTIWKEEAVNLGNVLSKYVDQYKKDCEIKFAQWPEQYGFEPPKMKRYMPGGKESFPEHVDVLGYETAKRFLITLIYLDDNQGGQTVIYPKDDLLVSPCKRGSMAIFPPLWPWIHVGKPPIDKPKYIIGSYLKYV